MKSEKIPFLRGTIILGVPATGKTFLLQHRALAALRDKPDAHLIYIGAPERPDPILALQRGARVVEEGEGLTVIEGERMTAYLCGHGDDAHRKARSFLLEALTAAWKPENRNKLIIALDEFDTIFREDYNGPGVSNMRDVVFDKLEALLDAPAPTITFLVTFQTVCQISACFGERGVGLFARFHEKFIFKCYAPRDIGSLAECGSVNPRALTRGEALHIFYGAPQLVDVGLSPNGSVSVKPHELKPVGYWRARELRGESMAEPIAAVLSYGLLVTANLAAVFFFIRHQAEWAAQPGFNMGILFYACSLALAAGAPYAVRTLHGWLTAAFSMTRARAAAADADRAG